MRAFNLDDEPLSPHFRAFQAHVATLDLERTLRGIGVRFERQGYDARLSCPFHDLGEEKKSVALRLEGEKAGFWHCWFPGCEKRGFLGTLLREIFQLDRPQMERLLGFTEDHELPRAPSGVLDWNALFANPAPLRPVISRRSWGSPPLPPPHAILKGSYPTPLFQTARLRQYLTSPARGFREPERVIEAFDLAVGEWVSAGEQVVPGVRCFFPIKNFAGGTVGWGARSMDGYPPKMIYPQGFPVTEVLGGEDRLSAMVAEGGEIVICEGRFDEMKLWDLGVPALSIWGSHLSEAHVRRLITAGVTSVTLAFDGDAAGVTGMRKAWGVIGGRLPVTWVALPAGRDPGSLATREEWEGLPRRPASALLFGG